MDASQLQDSAGRKATLPLILKAIRQHRGLKSSEVARAMGRSDPNPQGKARRAEGSGEASLLGAPQTRLLNQIGLEQLPSDP